MVAVKRIRLGLLAAWVGLLLLPSVAVSASPRLTGQSSAGQAGAGSTGAQSSGADSSQPVLHRKHPAAHADSDADSGQVSPQAADQATPAAQSGAAAQPMPASPASTASAAASGSADDAGPNEDAGAVVVPRLKRKTEDAPPPLPAPALRNPPGLGNLTLQVNVPEVTVDVGVLLEKTHQFVPDLSAANFAVYEDGKPQKILRFKRVEAPITALILAEFAATNYRFVYDMRNAAWAFAQQLRPQDYVALMTYDLRTHIITDFTQDKNQVIEGIDDLTLPGFSERNLFDALYQALDRMSRIEGQKYILLIGSGRDTFSRITLDKVLQKIRETPNVTIYSISTGGFLRAVLGGSPRFAASDVTYLQADNQMRTFAQMTGGMFFAPRFEGELPDDMGVINQAIRFKYQLVYHPTNSDQDGSFRRIQVELVDNEGRPMRFQDQKHHALKYDLIYRSGYRAQQQVQ